MLGGLILKPDLPDEDPEARLVPGVVPDRKRFCSRCGGKVSRDEGFCPKCGQPYSFIPTLKPGDVIAGKYEIKGTVAFGGLGWIYLAHDTLLRRRVILKGLLNAKDPALLAVAVQEREFLASVDHPAIVQIFDFITHGDQGFIVMEHVNGKTLMTLRKESKEKQKTPLPAAEAVSAIIGILPALGYLDEHDLVYCDFKPENVMVKRDGVKLIDLGGVRRVDDVDSDVYGTEGYNAPEASDNPSPVSDLYSVGRALAVLVADFDFQGKYKQSLPPPSEVPVFQQYESLYRCLAKATRVNPEERFQTAEEMADQLLGVLREITVGTVDLGVVDSPLFGEDPASRDGTSVLNTRAGRSGMPSIKVDPQDPAARVVTAAGLVADRAKRRAMFERSLEKFPKSEELPLRIAGELIATGALGDAEKQLGELQLKNPHDWRIEWYNGRAALAKENLQGALRAFAAVGDELPGELAPKLALGVVHELLGDLERAIGYYDLVSRIDPQLTGAAFGLGRCLLKKGVRADAVGAYQRVPATSSRYGEAQLAISRALIDASAGQVQKGDLLQAAETVEGLPGVLEGVDLHRITADVFRVAAERIEAGTVSANAKEQLLGVALKPAALRLGAERELRACAHLATQRSDKIRFVEEANRVRPWTWT
jgi:serine/threonine-protein kinase PknG